MTGKMMMEIEKIDIKVKPDWILVYGDTNSTLAGALVASKLHIKLAHVEAGLRSFNMQMPEEINRILTDRVSNLLFCPSQTVIDYLKKEGFDIFLNKKIHNVGDIMYDYALYYSNKSLNLTFDLPNKYILTTLHIAENTNDKVKLIEIISSLNKKYNK